MDQLSPYEEEFYPDILRGLSTYFDSPFVLNIARTAQRFRRPDLAHALNRKQIACKTWLIEQLISAYGPSYGTIWVLGGWYGVLAALMYENPGISVSKFISIDVDEGCAPVAQSLNREQVADGTFETLTADMHTLDYASGTPDLVVNTSCEHIKSFTGWFESLPKGTRLALQSNDYFGEPDHVNCAASLDAFKAQAPMSEFAFAGELEQKNYTRFMLIGRR